MLAAAFDPKVEKQHRWLGWLWLIGLWAAGVFLWGKFLNWGDIPFDWLDWAEINAPRTAFLKDAVMKGVLPLHMPDSSALRGVTDRFMSIPDALLSPQILLLRFLEVGPFFLVNTVLLYTIGMFGLLWFRRRFSLSLVSFSALFLLFNFNGHILAHFSVGHTTWSGYLLFPWFAVMVFRMLGGESGWRWVSQTALVLFFIYLQGAFHQFIWGLMFLGLLGLTGWERFWPALKALVSACLLSMVRMLPPILLLGQFDDEFLGGYPTLMDILDSMLRFKYPAEAIGVRGMLSSLAWWEYDLYLGLAGTAFLAVFGVYSWVRHRRPESGFPALLLPIAGLALLSLGRVYRLVRLIPVPLLSGERASIRMIILPVVFLLILGAIELQGWLQHRTTSWIVQLTGLGLLLGMGHDLWQHAKAWQVTNAVSAFDIARVDLSIKGIANHSDPPYFTLLGVGAALSALTLITLLWLWRRESQREAA